jgi:peroxiredoxin
MKRTVAGIIRRSIHMAKVGDKIAEGPLHFGFPPKFVNVAERCAGKKLVIVGLPGAARDACGVTCTCLQSQT